MLACPLLLLLPLAGDDAGLAAGPTMFYLWSIATTALVIIGTRLDGGPSSPLDALLFLTLTFLAVAYSPYGVVVMGRLMTAAYLLFVELPGPDHVGPVLPGDHGWPSRWSARWRRPTRGPPTTARCC